MSKINDGGPAFPNNGWIAQSGMSLRDWFAGQALAGIDISMVMEHGAAYKLADAAYKLADAMLAAREAKQ